MRSTSYDKCRNSKSLKSLEDCQLKLRKSKILIEQICMKKNLLNSHKKTEKLK
jgi:hypothetical protein